MAAGMIATAGAVVEAMAVDLGALAVAGQVVEGPTSKPGVFRRCRDVTQQDNIAGMIQYSRIGTLARNEAQGRKSLKK